jgi:large subunit ribosomal protein L4e
MKATLKSAAGADKGEILLPAQFEEEVRPDLIKRAVLAIQSHKKQPYGSDPEAGKKYASKLSRRRRDYKTAYGIGISRVPRKIMSYRGSRFNWQGATAPNTVGGRQAHPPMVEKVIIKKINDKERRKAIRSAIAATAIKDLVVLRGHIVSDYPIVLEDNTESIKKTKEARTLLNSLGLAKELERSSRKSLKTGNPRRRGRKYQKSKGPLLVVSKPCELMKSAVNIPGVDVIEVEKLNAEALAPGTHIARLTIFTKSAVEKLGTQKLFMDKKSMVAQIHVEKQEQKKPIKKTQNKITKKVAEK